MADYAAENAVADLEEARLAVHLATGAHTAFFGKAGVIHIADSQVSASDYSSRWPQHRRIGSLRAVGDARIRIGGRFGFTNFYH